MGLLKLLTVLVIVFVHLAIISPAHGEIIQFYHRCIKYKKIIVSVFISDFCISSFFFFVEVLDISSKTSCSNEDGSVNIMYSCTASCGDRPCLFLLKNGETICKEEEQINDTVHTDVVTKCLTQSSMCVTNITTASSSLDCNQPGTITRTIESTISADDVNNSSMYAIRCWPPEGDETTEHFFYQDYILTKSPQCTSVSSDTSISTVTVTTTVIEYSLDLESSSPYTISSPSLSISTVTTSKVTSSSSSHSSRFTFSQSLSSSSSLSTTNQYTTTSKLTRSSSSLTRSSSSLSDNISFTSSTEPTFTTQGLTSEYLAIIIVSFCI